MSAEIPFIWVLIVTPTDNNSHARIMQDHKQKCARLVLIVDCKHILQPPEYLIFIVNRLNYININVAKNRSIIPMDLQGPYRFNLHINAGYHGHSINCGHCNASNNCCEQNLMSTILVLLNAISMITQPIYSIYIIVQRGVSLTGPRKVGADCLPLCLYICLSIEYMSRNRHRNLWVRQYISATWCQVWFRY